MKAVFVHDHKFRRINGCIYSTGGLSNEILSRYTQFFEEMVVIGRILDERQEKTSYSLINNQKISVLTNVELENSIVSADAVIVRLPSINGYKAIHVAKKYNKPYLVEVVGCTLDAYWNYGIKGKIFALPAYLIMKWSVYFSPYVVYVTKKFLEKRYPTKGKCQAISDVELMCIDNDVIEKRVKSIDEIGDGLLLGTIAAIDVPYKGHEYVIKAIPQIEKALNKKVRYQLVGSGSSERLRKIAEEAGVADRVEFFGSMPHEKVFGWLDEIDIYMQPSLLEGLSRAVIEAMSRGLPCIASDKGGNPELIEDSFLVDIRNKNKISQNIVTVITPLKNKKIMSTVAKKNFERSFDYDKNKLDTLRYEFYHEFKEYAKKV